MIYMNFAVSGSDMGTELSTDPEEMAYLLDELVTQASDDFPQDVASYFHGDVDLTVGFLQALIYALRKGQQPLTQGDQT